jgi:hypothetical protein
MSLIPPTNKVLVMTLVPRDAGCKWAAVQRAHCLRNTDVLCIDTFPTGVVRILWNCTNSQWVLWESLACLRLCGTPSCSRRVRSSKMSPGRGRGTSSRFCIQGSCSRSFGMHASLGLHRKRGRGFRSATGKDNEILKFGCDEKWGFPSYSSFSLR